MKKILYAIKKITVGRVNARHSISHPEEQSFSVKERRKKSVRKLLRHDDDDDVKNLEDIFLFFLLFFSSGWDIYVEK